MEEPDTNWTFYVKRLFHWGPILALSVIFIISCCAIMCNLQWWPLDTVGGILNMLVFLIWDFLTLYNFMNAAFVGPGFVPIGWKPKKEEENGYLQYCKLCLGYKAPRSHHCRKCDRCVMKMDHHCPWINTCCGHKNHAKFTYFLFFAPCGCMHACVILISSMYRALYLHYYIYYGIRDVPYVNLGIYAIILCMFGTGLAIGVIVAVGLLFCIQFKSIMRNETGIEQWIRDKASYRDRSEAEGEFVYPYDLGRWNNIKQVLTWDGDPVSDGITWDVREGCDQYTLTIEQLRQKEDKRDRTAEYSIKENYGGSYCPISKGIRVLYHPPCTDEPRIKIQKGDKVMVTRWKKYWLYGDKVLDRQIAGAKRIRGWFPRRCAIELINNGYSYPLPPEPQEQPPSQEGDGSDKKDQ